MRRLESRTFCGLFFLALSLFPCVAGAQEPQCKGSPEVQECRWIRGGVVNLTADAGIVLWTDDEWPTEKPRRRVLGERDMPQDMYRAFDQSLQAMLHGDFGACFHKKWDTPYDRESVCIESVANLRVELPTDD